MTEPRYSICELAFPDTSIEEDIEIALSSGAAGIGVDEGKFGDRAPAQVAKALSAAGLKATCCVPAVMSFLPGEVVNGPQDIDERVNLMCEGVRKLAELGPSSILCLTGPAGALAPDEARKRAGEALHKLAGVADSAGVPLSFETFRFSDPQNYSIVFGLEDAVAFLAEAGRPDVPLAYDVWHVWGSSDRLLELTRELAPRINVVQLNDVRHETRAWADRVLPGDGVADLPGIFAALRQGGFDNWFDLEVFSDDGRWGNDFPDSVWKLPWAEQARRGHEGLLAAWNASSELISGQEA